MPASQSDQPAAADTAQRVDTAQVLVALDVGYSSSTGRGTGLVGVVAFRGWEATEPIVEMTVTIDEVNPYVSGRLFERELPCLAAGLDALQAAHPLLDVTTVLVDGNVRLDTAGAPGLGMYLYRHLGQSVPVVGIAKKSFKGLDAVEVLRGSSTKPLFVTAAGMDETSAAAHVASMAGPFRLPTLIRRADQLTRGAEPAS